MKVAVVGLGVLGKAIVARWLDSKVLSKKDLFGISYKKEKSLSIACTSNYKEKADLYVIAVKPHSLTSVLEKLKPGSNLVSLVTGVPISAFKGFNVARVITNTPALIGAGVSAVSFSEKFNKRKEVLKLLEALGEAFELPESNSDILTALTASGPAFFYTMVEALADGAVAMGLRRKDALKLAALTMRGAAEMVLKTGIHPASLKDDVTTPSGCTIEGLHVLEEGNLRATLARALRVTTNKAKGLGELKSNS